MRFFPQGRFCCRWILSAGDFVLRDCVRGILSWRDLDLWVVCLARSRPDELSPVGYCLRIAYPTWLCFLLTYNFSCEWRLPLWYSYRQKLQIHTLPYVRNLPRYRNALGTLLFIITKSDFWAWMNTFSILFSIYKFYLCTIISCKLIHTIA